MTLEPKTHAEILAEVIEERAQRVTFTRADMQPKLARLRAGFAEVDAKIAARRSLLRALDTLPLERRSGWLEGVQASVRIFLGKARKTSEIIVDGARDLLPLGSDAWSFASDAFVTRDDDDRVTRAGSEGLSGVVRTIYVDDGFVGDRAAKSRVTSIVSNFPSDSPRPRALIVEVVEDDRVPRVWECDPEATEIANSTCTLRYEPNLPPGSYTVYFGNASSKDE